HKLVAAEMMQRVQGPAGAAAVSIAAMISIFAALNGSILSGARVPYAAARDGLFFKSAARVHPAFHTPGVAIMMLTGWSCVLVLFGLPFYFYWNKKMRKGHQNVPQIPVNR